MADQWQGALTGAIALAGVAVGAWLNSRAADERWKRDFLVTRIAELREHFLEIVEAIDAQVRVTAQAMEAVEGLRPPIPRERVESAGIQWARVFARKSLIAPANVQESIVAFDQARAIAADAVNSGDSVRMASGLASLETARGKVLAELNDVVTEMRELQATLLLPVRIRWWRRLRRQPIAD